MKSSNTSRASLWGMGILFFVTALPVSAQETTRKTEGLDENAPAVYALTGATIHLDANTVIKEGTIVVVRERIADIRKGEFIPDGAQQVDLKGKHVYPGFVDPHVEYSVDWSATTGTAYWNDNVRPQLKISDWFDLDLIEHEDLRKSGICAGLFVPDFGVMRGQSSVLLTSPVERELAILKKDFAQHALLSVDRRGGRRGYPNSPMGGYALARQAMYDAKWYADAKRVARNDPTVDRPETNTALEALQPLIDGEQMLMAETSNEIFALRAHRFAKEFGIKLAIMGSGEEYRHLEEVAALSRSLIIPVDFPDAPEVASPEQANEVSLEDLMHWDIAPENPMRLEQASVTFSFSATGLDKPTDLLKQVRTAIKRGLSEAAALNALTANPARFLGLENQLGRIDKGYLANLVVTNLALFEDDSEIEQCWVAGRQFEFEPQPLRQLAGRWKISAEGFEDAMISVKSSDGELSAEFATENDGKEKDEGKADEKSEDVSEAEKPDAIEFKGLQLDGTRLSGAFRSDSFGFEGISQLSLVIGEDDKGLGRIVLPDGKQISATAEKLADEEKEDDEEDEKQSKDEDVGSSFAVNYPLGAYGRDEAPAQPKSVLIKNVTIWTCGDKGRIENGSILFGNGIIEGVYTSDAELPAADLVIDGNGRHVSPGIIDCHSHSASDSGINESGQAVTAEVRIGDFIDADSINIYRQLAGGVTTINILHGSSNPIGGQNQVLKLRWGALDEEMKFTEAPQGIKFALGENVKRSNSSRRPGEPVRYPNTRMGVAEIIENAFRAAKEYRQRQADWARNKTGLPPRVDLELEALAEIVEGKRWIHCHSYRQDEILALIRILDRHGITIGTFQHILEGYKVAHEMAEHGAMASAFADWWAYKYEVKDAIPYAGALMHRAGVNVSFNSDDAELARHLNHEAAKAVRYGNVSEEEALKFVTLNPAMQLRIDKFVGSLEKGKHADLVIWSGHPMSTMSRCEQTWVDGRKYFDLKDDLAARELNQKRRAALIQKILASGDKMKPLDKSKVDQAKLWPRYDENCGMSGHHFDGRQFDGQQFNGRVHVHGANSK